MDSENDFTSLTDIIRGTHRGHLTNIRKMVSPMTFPGDIFV